MNSEQDGLEDDHSEVFLDTSVLFDYALDGCPKAEKLFRQTSISKVISNSVNQEFQRVYRRRKKLHKAVLKYAKSGELAEFEPANEFELTENDRRHVEELLDELMDLEKRAEAIRRLNEKRRQLKTAKRELFTQEDQFVSQISTGSRDPMLQGYLNAEIDNEADVRVICDAVELSISSGSGCFLSSDVKDMLSQKDEINRQIRQYNENGLLYIYAVEPYLAEYHEL